jgi:ABC-type xylose transport system permease subunit
MYFRSSNEILASLVCILNIVRLEFQIQTLFFYFKPNRLTLVCNSKSYIQVYPTKFTFVMTM